MRRLYSAPEQSALPLPAKYNRLRTTYFEEASKVWPVAWRVAVTPVAVAADTVAAATIIGVVGLLLYAKARGENDCGC